MAVAEADIISGGAYSIKQYYEESGNPKQMRGASQLLEDMFSVHISKILKDHNVAEDSYYSLGSELFAVVPVGMGACIIEEIEEKFNDVCQTAQFSFVTIKTTTKELEENYVGLISDLQILLEKKRYESIFAIGKQDAPDPKWASNHVGVKEFSDNKPCRRCRLRPGRYVITIEKKEYTLCTACAKKDIRAQNLTTAKDMDAIADEYGDIAVLYADVNNLGSCRSGSFLADKAFRKRVNDDVHKVVAKAFETILPNEQQQIKKQQIACAGDDVCLIIPGKYALKISSLIASDFSSLDDGGKPLTISVGAAIAPSHTAIDYFHHIVEQLLKSAKSLAYREKQSCLDIYRIGGDGQTATKLAKLRDDPEKPGYESLFPMTAEQAREFAKLLRDSDVSKSSLRNLADAYRVKPIVEADLYRDYLLAKLAGAESGEQKKQYDNLKNISVFRKDVHPWHDFVVFASQEVNN